jgi:hypothetical protein
MEDVFLSLAPKQQDWLVKQLGPHISIKDFVRNLLVKEFLTNGESSVKAPKKPGKAA